MQTVSIEKYEQLRTYALESKMIIENIQKLLGVCTTTEALARIVELQKIEKESCTISNSEITKLLHALLRCQGRECGPIQDRAEKMLSKIKNRLPAALDGLDADAPTDENKQRVRDNSVLVLKIPRR